MLPYQTNDPSSSPGGLSWEGLFNQLGPSFIGGAGTYLSGQQLQKATNDAANVAGYKPTSITGPGGGVTSVRNPDGSLSYTLSGGPGGSALSPLAQFSGSAAGAGSNLLSAFNNFNPQDFANTQYADLSALAAPGETDQTQQLLNYEQKTGRGSLTQNGQLGDLGGLQLALSTADNQRRLQAQQLALQQQQSLASNAATLGGASTNALGGVSNYNSSLLDMLRTAMTGSTGQAYAGNNVGKLIYDTGQTRANQTGNLFGSALEGMSGSGGVGTYGKNLFNQLKNLFGGSNTGTVVGDTSGAFPAAGQGALSNAFDSSGSGVSFDASGNPVWNTGLGDPSASFDATQGFSSAGGEATDTGGMTADAAQGYTAPQGVAGWSATGAGTGGVDLSALGAASQGADAAIGSAASGSVASDAAAIQAANDSYLAGEAGGTAAAGSGGAGASGATLGAGVGGALALAGIAAPVIAGMRSSDVAVGKDYWNQFSNTLNSGSFKTGNSTYDANTTPAQRQSAFDQTIVSVLAGGGPQSMGGITAAQRLPPDVLAYARSRGLLDAANAQQFAGLHAVIGGGPIGGVHTVGRNQY